MSRNRVDSLTNKRGLRVARPNEGQAHNEKRPRKAEPQSPFGAGNEIRTHDFNLGNIRLAPNTIREIQQHQPHSVPWRCVPSRGVPWKVEGWVEGSRFGGALVKDSRRAMLATGCTAYEERGEFAGLRMEPT